MLNIKVLKALNGDCIIVSYGGNEKHHILIDGGQGRLCFQQLWKFINSIQQVGEKIDLIILTHIDSDHIVGILRLLSQKEFNISMIEEIWFDFGEGLKKIVKIGCKNQTVSLFPNSTEISWKQGTDLEEKIQKAGIKRRVVKKLDKFSIGGANITILSPSIEMLQRFAHYEIKEEKSTTEIAYINDYHNNILELNYKEVEKQNSLTNDSSIACLFEFDNHSILLLGDAAADEIVKSLRELGYSENNKLKVDYCKIAHHASKHNTTNELIQMIDCSNYIISTQQTAQGRPSKECLSRIICNSENQVNFYCNYELKWDEIFTKDELLKYHTKFIILEECGIDVGEE